MKNLFKQLENEDTGGVIMKTTVPINVEDVAFLDVMADKFGTTRSKLITKALSFSVEADFLFLLHSKPQIYRDDFVHKVEERALELGLKPQTVGKHKSPVTKYGLINEGIVEPDDVLTSFLTEGEENA